MLRIIGIIYCVILLVVLAGCKTPFPGWGGGNGGDGLDDQSGIGGPGGGMAPEGNYDAGLHGGDPGTLPPNDGGQPGGQTGGTFAHDTLYAIPGQTTASVGEVVTVTIASGTPGNPLRFVNGIGLTVETGATYHPDTFNVGAPGGAPTTLDGFWTAMGPESFLLPPDNLIYGREREIGNGRHRLDLNVTPLGGREVMAGEGELVNIGLVFADPGTYRLGFEEFNGVSRTYYSDSETTEYYWGDISNDHAGFANTIVVD